MHVKPFTPQQPSHNFAKLISWSVPYKHEKAYYGPLLDKLGWTYHDGVGYHYETAGARIMFTAHLDVACVAPFKPQIIKHGSLWESINGPMGADDRAGVAVLLHMAHVTQVPGDYWLFIGEERGCLGSRKLARDQYFYPGAVVMSLDREGCESVITHQLGKRACSEKLALTLVDELKYSGMYFRLDPTGLVTDSAQFVGHGVDCLNLSIGYRGNHFAGETQDVAYIDKLGTALASINWDAVLLATEKDGPNRMFDIWDIDTMEYLGTEELYGDSLEEMYEFAQALYVDHNVMLIDPEEENYDMPLLQTNAKNSR